MFSAIPSKKKEEVSVRPETKKTMKKIISLVVVAIMLAMTTIPASATNTLVATQTGSSSAPAFKLNESKAYCLDSELKAPQEVEYEYSTSYSNEGVKNILVNAYLNSTNQRVVQLALWGQLNGNVKRYRTIAKYEIGDKAVGEYDSLFAEVNGNYNVNCKVYTSKEAGYQRLLTATVKVVEPEASEPEVSTPVVSEPEISKPTVSEPEAPKSVVSTSETKLTTTKKNTKTPVKDVEVSSVVEEAPLVSGTPEFLNWEEDAPITSPDVPKTGEESSWGVRIALILLALSMLGIVFLCGKKEKEEEEPVKAEN